MTSEHIRTDNSETLVNALAEIERLRAEVERVSAAPVVSDVIHHSFGRDRDIGWNASEADQALRALFEEWLKASQFTKPNSPWDIWKACAKSLQAAPAERGAIPDECPHMIVFDDADREPLMFSGTGARSSALQVWAQISNSWNAHLFVRIERNCRDDRYPCARLNPAPATADSDVREVK